MSTYLSAENLGHQFHDNWLFKNVTIGINRGRKVALVGVNGAGKSTLLKILGGTIKPTEGKVVQARDLNMGYLEQDPDFKNAVTISDYIFHADDVQQQLIRRYEELMENDPENTKAIEKVMEEMSEVDAWEYEYKIKTILGRLDIHHLNQHITTLSGGQKKRLALAKLLIEDPEVYILDEPTNHLDIDTIEWLEKLLTEGNKTILMVTHDRYFLDNVCNEILEIDRGKIQPYNGSYGYYLEKKAEREAADEAAFQKNSNLLRKELEWMRRQPQARGTKSKARIDAYYDLEEKTKNGGIRDKVELSVKTARQGNKIMEMDHLYKSFNGNTYINNFSYIFKKGDRIGLAGKNGSGKSTLLNIITGALQPDQGTVVKGETTVIGYFHQAGITFKEDERVIDIVKNVAEFITMADGKTISASALLTLFLFPPAKQYGFISKLSGGEKKRLQLMSILMKNPNFLILDEPTNDLDIDTLNVLEEFLTNYGGVLMMVSHDRYLLDKLTDQLFIMEEKGHVRIFNGNYSSYRLELEEAKQQAKKPAPVAQTQTPAPKKSKLSFKEAKELENIEGEINTIEASIKDKNEQLNASGIDPKKLDEILKQIEVLNKQLDDKSARWMELTELNEG
ncbi:ABC-F family ATP-binding cassette domain-containing protein [Mucilaginibacter rubeus]|uniref:ABC-F family ATP-binding cassette domain-containing protein n=2 Tax=Sphingobacteriaceae TaxID=84566 RepID=A0AAE6JK77_9SPHI|nr:MULTISPECIES: ABC-F family ATP-binding cassette domain-containing protein [Mucilaginibacter]QEM06871.1 ABC-F family ATP-binding cassette domain-containing protein [Mucilaginibacter rubeus]QEM19460.1 ABC-F family ATP-binding cassette domain-containing protein [Mucilaginibacter gossypii]QTE43992.1 ABC-F family ATP-binding cassette domain-containing protein [Mucilaginibacter rubeus]QTE50593.1 ABC-F family ATP-binding cassette domain-containing protein [Mucilaginibacter rubeus]QTE55678.1 ABC-F 